jgi:PAS domain S-box-containing protein
MGDLRLATWLVRERGAIQAALRAELGAALPPDDTAEAEVLRRFRSFAAAALAGGHAAEPALEGLRVAEPRAERLLAAWVRAAARCAGPEAAGPLSAALEPLLARFAVALRATAPARRAAGVPQVGRRRVVAAAIDRVADAFLALDADTATIADANPAAGALLGASRETLLGSDAMRFVPESARALWWAQLDAMLEGGEPRRFRAPLVDSHGRALRVDASITRYATRARTLALVVARPEAPTADVPGGRR